MTVAHVVRLTRINFDIFRAEVLLVAVDVVYHFSRLQGAAKLLLSYYPVCVAPVELWVGLALALAQSSGSVLLSVSVLCLPASRIPLSV